MSTAYYIALTDGEITKTKYKYADILPNMRPDDMLYSYGISFHKELTPAEEKTWKSINNPPTEFNVYAIHTGFMLNYKPTMSTLWSPQDARNAFDEIKWFLSFIKKLLKRNDSVFVIAGSLGLAEVNRVVRTRYIEINEFDIDENENFEFEYGVMYQFVDNSPESIERKKKAHQQNLQP